MSANGNEAVTLSQLKEALNSSSSSGIPLCIKPLYRDVNIDTLGDINDAGIYYRAEGGTYEGDWPWGASSFNMLIVAPYTSDFYNGSWYSVQFCVSEISNRIAFRCQDTDGTWEPWYELTNKIIN